MKKKTNNNEHCMNTPWNDKYVMSTPCDCYILIYVQYYINVRINSTLICDISPEGTGEVRLGEDPRRRSYVDSARHLLMVPDLDTGSTVNGEVRGFEFHARNTNQVQISVWRRESGEHFRLVNSSN